MQLVRTQVSFADEHVIAVQIAPQLQLGVSELGFTRCGVGVRIKVHAQVATERVCDVVIRHHRAERGIVLAQIQLLIRRVQLFHRLVQEVVGVVITRFEPSQRFVQLGGKIADWRRVVGWAQRCDRIVFKIQIELVVLGIDLIQIAQQRIDFLAELIEVFELWDFV